MNGFQSLPAWQSYFNHPKGAKLGFLNASQSVGSVLALPVIGWMSDRLGRRISLGVGALIIVIASILQAAAVNYGMFVFARVLVGIGSIMVVQPSPLLLAEVSYPTHRGVYTALFWTMFYLGAIIAAWSTYGTNKNLPGSMWGWRAPSIIQGVFPLLQLIFVSTSHPSAERILINT
jgi:MFS family permease